MTMLVCEKCQRIVSCLINGLCRSCNEEFSLKPQPTPDTINHPSHYTTGLVEPIDVIEDWKLSFCLGNVIKYIARANYKGKRIEDLKKARWYLDREIQQLERIDRATQPNH